MNRHCSSLIHAAAIALLIVVVAPLSSALGNGQKSYDLRSPEYEALRTLSIEAGVALPFSSGPFTEAEMRAVMDRLAERELSEAGDDLFAWLRSRLQNDGGYTEEDGRIVIGVDPEVTLETYLHTDRDNRFMEYSSDDRRPLLRLPLEGWVGNGAYAVFDLALIKNIPDFSIYPTYRDDRQYGFDEDGDFEHSTSEEDPWTNAPIDINTIDVQFPHRAFLSVGGDRWNARIGRDTVDWGNGRTGNLYISDAAEWYDTLQLSTFWQRFKFSWLWASLDGKIVDAEREFETATGWDTDGDGVIDTYVEPDDLTGVEQIVVHTADIEKKNLIAHRWELRLWERLGLAYTEGIIFGRDTVELRHLNPLYHYHNLYTNTQSIGNAHRSFEFDFAVTPGLSLYAVLSPDQWSSPLEPSTNVTEEPNAVAYLAGLDGRRAIGDGFLHATVEGVYSSAWMYIHNHPLTSITTRRFVMAQHGSRVQLWYDEPIGHYGGNDFALVWFDISYGKAGRYRYGFSGSYEGDGSVPLNALLESRVSEGIRDALTEDEATLSSPSDGYADRKAQWKAVARLYGEIEPWFLPAWNGGPGSRSLRVGSELAAQWMKNRYNRPDDWRFDLQWVLSATVGW